MATDQRDIPPIEDPKGQLERGLIDEFLWRRGYSREAVSRMPESEAKPLLAAASIYAAAKLTEIESRSHYVHDIHGARRGSET
jgi:hypothetical protein